jgi:two-component system, LytTR family, response regulator
MQTIKSPAKQVSMFPVHRSSAKPLQDTLIIHNTEFIDVLRINEIQYVRAENNYSRFVMRSGEVFLSSKNLGAYESQLLHHEFIRPHQSFIVNTHDIRRIRKSPECSLTITGGIQIPVARSRRKEILQRFADRTQS